MNKTIAIIVAVVVVGFGAWYFMKSDYSLKKDEMQATSPPEEAVVSENGAVMGEKQVVVYTDEGYVPSSLIIKAGEVVEFRNESSRETWPASAKHPTHTGYPGTDIKKCDTAEAGEMFDSCGGIAPGASWTFTFNEKEEWGYHDHLDAKKFGKIIVE